MDSKPHVYGFIDFVSHVKIRQNGWTSNITAQRAIGHNRTLTRQIAARFSFLGLGINIQNRRTKRNIGAGQLAHPGGIEQNRGRVLGIGSGTCIGGTHRAGALFIEGKTTCESAGRCGERRKGGKTYGSCKH